MSAPEFLLDDYDTAGSRPTATEAAQPAAVFRLLVVGDTCAEIGRAHV